MKKIKQFANLASIKKSIVISAASSLAIGVAAIIPAAPAGAVLLNSGNFSFADGTTDFFTSLGQTSYTVNFNNTSGAAFINSATGAFSSSFAPGSTPAVTPSTGIFSLVSGNIFSLASPLSFNFPVNGVNVSIDSGSTFTRTFNNVNSGVGFADLSVTGRVANADGTVNLQALSFTFNDNPNPGGGSYSVTLSPNNPLNVPEPFSVIGTIVGGTAAFRMRKKLANAGKHN
jgi:hypothetical protein